MILFKSMRVIKVDNLNKELFEKIEKIITAKRDIGVGKIYTPTEKSFEENYVSNKIIISIESNDQESSSILASRIYNELKELDIDFDWKLTPGPGIRLTFKGEKPSMDEKTFNEILYKRRLNGGVVRGTLQGYNQVYGASFHLNCQNHVFDELLDEILNDFKDLGYELEISYYYIG